MHTSLDPHESAIAGHDLTDSDRTIRALVWYVVTPGFLAGIAIVAWAVWTIVRGLA